MELGIKKISKTTKEMPKSAVGMLTLKIKISTNTNRLWRDQNGVKPIMDPKAKPIAMLCGSSLDWRVFINFEINFSQNNFVSSLLQ